MRAKGIVENFQLVLQLLILYGVNREVVSKATVCPILCPSTPRESQGNTHFCFQREEKGKEREITYGDGPGLGFGNEVEVGVDGNRIFQGLGIGLEH